MFNCRVCYKVITAIFKWDLEPLFRKGRFYYCSLDCKEKDHETYVGFNPKELRGRDISSLRVTQNGRDTLPNS